MISDTILMNFIILKKLVAGINIFSFLKNAVDAESYPPQTQNKRSLKLPGKTKSILNQFERARILS